MSSDKHYVLKKTYPNGYVKRIMYEHDGDHMRVWLHVEKDGRYLKEQFNHRLSKEEAARTWKYRIDHGWNRVE